MIALEILKTYINKNIGMCAVPQYVKDSITELEEVMKPKTCEGCRNGAFGVDGLGFEVECRIGYNCSRGREDRYKPKEQL